MLMAIQRDRCWSMDPLGRNRLGKPGAYSQAVIGSAAVAVRSVLMSALESSTGSTTGVHRNAHMFPIIASERSRWRDGRFACLKDQVYAQDETALHCSARTV